MGGGLDNDRLRNKATCRLERRCNNKDSLYKKYCSGDVYVIRLIKVCVCVCLCVSKRCEIDLFGFNEEAEIFREEKKTEQKKCYGKN